MPGFANQHAAGEATVHVNLTKEMGSKPSVNGSSQQVRRGPGSLTICCSFGLSPLSLPGPLHTFGATYWAFGLQSDSARVLNLLCCAEAAPAAAAAVLTLLQDADQEACKLADELSGKLTTSAACSGVYDLAHMPQPTAAGPVAQQRGRL